MVRPTAPRLALVAALGLLAGACGSTEPAGYEAADRIITAAGLDRDSTATESAPGLLAAASCETEIRTDEYGLEFEVCADADDVPATSDPAADDTDAPGPGGTEANAEPAADSAVTDSDHLDLGRFDEVVADLPAGAGREQLRALGLALDEMDQACTSSTVDWQRELTAVTDQLLPAAEAVLSDGGLASVVGEASGRELAQVVVERVMIPTGCLDLPPGPTVGSAEELAEQTARAAVGVEYLYEALWGQAKSPFFYHPDELAHRRWMRDAKAEGTDIDLLVAGTSQTLLGVEADLLGPELGLEAGMVALPGAVAEVQQYWLLDAVELVDPDVVVWGIGPLDLVTICRPDGRAEEYARLARLKDDVMTNVPAASELAPIDLLIGPAGSSVFADAPTSVALDRRFPGERGDAFEFAQPDPSELVASLEQFRAPFERGDRCVERLDVIERTISELVADGRRVVVFGMPIAPLLAETSTGGLDVLVGLTDQAAVEVFVPAGADYLGMMRSLDDDGLWYDVVHPTRAGGQALTAEVATAYTAVLGSEGQG